MDWEMDGRKVHGSGIKREGQKNLTNYIIIKLKAESSN